MEMVIEGSPKIHSGASVMHTSVNASGEVHSDGKRYKYLDILCKWKPVKDEMMEVFPDGKPEGFEIDYVWTRGKDVPAAPNQGPTDPAYILRIRLVEKPGAPAKAPTTADVAVNALPMDSLKEQAVELGIKFTDQVTMQSLQQSVKLELAKREKVKNK